jgi:hypothetical protein
MDHIILRAYASEGYFIQQQDENFMWLGERGQSCVPDIGKENFWLDVVNFLDTETITLTLNRVTGICPSCRNHPIFDPIDLRVNIYKPSIVYLFEKGLGTQAFLKTYVYFFTDRFKKAKQLFKKYECEFGEVEVLRQPPFPCKESTTYVGIYIPLKVISNIIIPIEA